MFQETNLFYLSVAWSSEAISIQHELSNVINFGLAKTVTTKCLGIVVWEGVFATPTPPFLSRHYFNSYPHTF